MTCAEANKNAKTPNTTKAPLTQDHEVYTTVHKIVFFSLCEDFAEVCVGFAIKRVHFLKLRVHFGINLVHSVSALKSFGCLKIATNST